MSSKGKKRVPQCIRPLLRHVLQRYRELPHCRDCYLTHRDQPLYAFYPIESQAQFTVWSAFSARPRQLPPFQRPCFRASDYFQELPPVINQALKVIEEKGQIRVLSRSSDTRSAEPIA